MAHATLAMDQVWDDFRALSSASRVAFLKRLLTDEELRDELEDASDLLDFAERRGEPTVSCEEVMEGIRSRMTSQGRGLGVVSAVEP